jgi:uncharacterized membrane protein
METKQIILDNEFKDYEHFCLVLINEIFRKEEIKDVINYIDTETDETKRIFLDMEDGSEYTIRLWNVYDTEDDVTIDYTLFYDDSNRIHSI